MTRGQNLVERIVQRFAADLPAGRAIRSGDIVSVVPVHVMTHDNTSAVIPKFEATGASRVHDPRQPVFALDHNVQDRSRANLAKYRRIEGFAAEHGVDCYPAGRGIGHQVLCEEGYAWPGSLVVASDSHSNMYGGLGCLGTPVVRTDAAAIWASGQTWWRVPPVARVELRGALRAGVTGKDVALTLCGHFRRDEVLNCAVEFVGEGVSSLSISARLTIANTTTEWGALAGVFPVDGATIEWLRQRATHVAARGLAGVPSDVAGHGRHPRLSEPRIAELERDPPRADPDAHYERELTLDLATVSPHVAGPDQVRTITPVTELRDQRVRIDKAYLVSCVNSRLEDLAAAAEVLRGRRVAEHVELYVAAASSEVQQQAEEAGHWQTLLDAGARLLPPGCGPCIGLGVGLLQDGEVGISATNRNFKGRMGSRDAQTYLASPQVVAASAAAGQVDWPGAVDCPEVVGSFARAPVARAAAAVEIVPGFEPRQRGRLLVCPRNDINTDAIYAGKYTYRDDMTAAQQAAVAMENYDRRFAELVRDGDILVAGDNFGVGSSREQAVTALVHAGIRLVLAGSLSETYRRNALNNGLIAIEAPELCVAMKTRLGCEALTVATGLVATVDFEHRRVELTDERYPLANLGPIAQQLVVAGGLEAWVRQRLSAMAPRADARPTSPQPT